MRDVKDSVDVGDVERHLGCDVSPGLGRRVSVQEMQTGHVSCMTFTKRTNEHMHGEKAQRLFSRIVSQFPLKLLCHHVIFSKVGFSGSSRSHGRRCECSLVP